MTRYRGLKRCPFSSSTSSKFSCCTEENCRLWLNIDGGTRGVGHLCVFEQLGIASLPGNIFENYDSNNVFKKDD